MNTHDYSRSFNMRARWGMLLFTILLFLAAETAFSAELELQKVTDGVYALVGELAQRSPQNLGNNATFGLVLTSEGPVLIDSGGTYKGAQQIAAAIRTITDKPIAAVINTGGQDHRWLGNGFFKKRDACLVIAANAAVADQRSRLNSQLDALERLVGEQAVRGTGPVYADRTFERALDLKIGGVSFQIRYPGPAHTPGDSYVWLPQQKVLFSGDIVYVERMLAVGSVSKSGAWIKAFEEIAALKPEHIVPGHGHVTTLEQARADTYDYLVALRKSVKDMIDRGIGMEEVGTVDQSRFSYLKFYKELKGRNAQQVYQELEWE